MKNPKVLVVMGSDSDFSIVENCIELLKDFEIQVDVHVCSAHRTPDKAVKLAIEAENNGFELIIAAAGKAAHLPGVLAAYTTLPVIGLPIKSSFEGLDNLFSIVKMPPDIPVATVAVDGAQNAAILAVQMLSIKYDELRSKMKEYRKAMADKVDEKNKSLRNKLML